MFRKSLRNEKVFFKFVVSVPSAHSDKLYSSFSCISITNYNVKTGSTSVSLVSRLWWYFLWWGASQQRHPKFNKDKFWNNSKSLSFYLEELKIEFEKSYLLQFILLKRETSYFLYVCGNQSPFLVKKSDKSRGHKSSRERNNLGNWFFHDGDPCCIEISVLQVNGLVSLR